MVTIIANMSSLVSQRNISVDRYLNYDDNDVCNECEQLSPTLQCDRCGNSVCNNVICHWSFPHKFNTNFIICKGCFTAIDNKLINYNHLLIYNFIKNNTTRRRHSC
jgi:hypothetical protein